MNLFIVILLIKLINLFGDKFGSRISKHLLRGMYKEDREKQSLKWFEMTFNNIFDKKEHLQLDDCFNILC